MQHRVVHHAVENARLIKTVPNSSLQLSNTGLVDALQAPMPTKFHTFQLITRAPSSLLNPRTTVGQISHSVAGRPDRAGSALPNQKPCWSRRSTLQKKVLITALKKVHIKLLYKRTSGRASEFMSPTHVNHIPQSAWLTQVAPVAHLQRSHWR